jgi:hypothetical protein
MATIVAMLGGLGCGGEHVAPGTDCGVTCGPQDAHDAMPDALVCAGAPSGGCDLVVADHSACPSVADLCGHGEVGGFECCFCARATPTSTPAWTTEYTDCFGNSVDAGADAGAPDAGVDAGP